MCEHRPISAIWRWVEFERRIQIGENSLSAFITWNASLLHGRSSAHRKLSLVKLERGDAHNARYSCILVCARLLVSRMFLRETSRDRKENSGLIWLGEHTMSASTFRVGVTLVDVHKSVFGTQIRDAHTHAHPRNMRTLLIECPMDMSVQYARCS